MIGRGFITAYGENVVILTKSRMYKSKSRAVKKAAAAIAACVRWSKIACYETPYSVTGAVQHTGLKRSLSAVEIE